MTTRISRSAWLKKFGRSIRFGREWVGITQAQLAEAIGVDKQTISRWETGRMAMDLWNFRKVAKVLGWWKGNA